METTRPMHRSQDTYHIVSERDDDELGILRSLFDIRSDDGDVSEIQRSVDFVHHIQWGWFVVMERKDQC